ncbi:hypothetical protein MAR_016116 [Mya arenaria]|uniref:B box-type domain-containing protein n=1 Tax=Mya arenaria TaxID=6604 RepID=A0ABY7FKM9_MYAAR|nr:hypothetical protein MAR_016116 [Mya arenaria]
MESSINKGSDCVLHSQQHEASDCVHDYQCSVCKAKGLNAEASYCCTECRKLYCNNCITFHTQILKEHQVLTTQDKAKWVEFDDIFCCKIHTKQSLAYFCEEHDVVCCQKCVSIDHGCCRKIVNLSSLASGIRTKDEFTDGILEVNRTQLKLRSTQEEKKTTQKALRKTSDEFVAKIRTLRKDIDNVLDKMEADTLQQVSTAEKHVCELLRCDIEELNDYDERLEILLNKISEKYGDSDTATCLAFRQCIDEMKQAQISLEEDALTPSYSMALTLNSDIHTRLSAEKAFADVKTTATRVRQIHIKCPDDKNTCNITGICELETGGIIIADGGNSSLKLLNTYKEIVCTYRLQPYLKDICKAAYLGPEEGMALFELLSHDKVGLCVSAILLSPGWLGLVQSRRKGKVHGKTATCVKLLPILEVKEIIVEITQGYIGMYPYLSKGQSCLSRVEEQRRTMKNSDISNTSQRKFEDATCPSLSSLTERMYSRAVPPKHKGPDCNTHVLYHDKTFADATCPSLSSLTEPMFSRAVPPKHKGQDCSTQMPPVPHSRHPLSECTPGQYPQNTRDQTMPPVPHSRHSLSQCSPGQYPQNTRDQTVIHRCHLSLTLVTH